MARSFPEKVDASSRMKTTVRRMRNAFASTTPKPLKSWPGELEDPGRVDVVQDPGAVLREVDAEPPQGFDEGAELPLQPLRVARKVVGEVVDRGADDDREPEQHADHREDHGEQGEGAGEAARFEPEDGRRADDRDEDREEEGVDERLGRFQPRHDDDERGRREEDGLDPQMVLRGRASCGKVPEPGAGCNRQPCPNEK